VSFKVDGEVSFDLPLSEVLQCHPASKKSHEAVMKFHQVLSKLTCDNVIRTIRLLKLIPSLWWKCVSIFPLLEKAKLRRI
jgi:hypothetical protein